MPQRKTATFTYNLVRSKRRSLSLGISEDGTITVRAPERFPAAEADRFVEEHRDWITEKRAERMRQKALRPVYTEEERKRGKILAGKIFEEKCRIFSERMGVTYGNISIREQKTRWGSCSARGNLNFNWKAALMPEEIQDYLVVHELSHRIEMNHSPGFWAVVEQQIPDYQRRREWLKKNGGNY